jgi:hypothetical protein
MAGCPICGNMIISQPVELIARTGRSAELGELGRQASDKRGAGRCDLDLRGHCPGPGVLRGTVNRRDRPRAADVQAGMRVVGIPKAIRPVLQDHVSRFVGPAPAAHGKRIRRTGSGAGLRDLMARMGHDSERAAIIYGTRHGGRRGHKRRHGRPGRGRAG